VQRASTRVKRQAWSRADTNVRQRETRAPKSRDAHLPLHQILEVTMRCLLIGAGIVISLGAHGLRLGAQSPVSVGVGAGVVVPVGALRHDVNPGLRALAMLDLGVPEMPFGLRVDAAYDRLGFQSTPVGAARRETGARTVASASINLTVVSSDWERVVSPYAIGGVGFGRIACAGRSDCGVSTQMGWNAGVGMRLGLFALRGFAEARMHCVPKSEADDCYIPVIVGLRF
jgi:hypothetical protein